MTRLHNDEPAETQKYDDNERATATRRACVVRSLCLAAGSPFPLPEELSVPIQLRSAHTKYAHSPAPPRPDPSGPDE